MRVEYRAADTSRFSRARAAHGPPSIDQPARAEWISGDKGLARAVAKDGGQEELVHLGLARERGFFTQEEIDAEIARRGSKK
jgi:hypothetical protein